MKTQCGLRNRVRKQLRSAEREYNRKRLQGCLDLDLQTKASDLRKLYISLRKREPVAASPPLHVSYTPKTDHSKPMMPVLEPAKRNVFSRIKSFFTRRSYS